MEQIKIGTSTGKAEKTIRHMKGKTERDMEVVILKNRNGKVGDELQFKYCAMFHYFTSSDELKNNSAVFGDKNINHIKSSNWL